MTTVQPTVTQTIEIAATPEAVYELITDLDVLAEVAEEAGTMRWRRGSAAGPGAVFTGVNHNGRRRWTTRCTVTDAVYGRMFAFEVDLVLPGTKVARWQYDLAPTETGCAVTESTWDRRSRPFAAVSGLVTGVRDRQAASQEHIAATLRRLKERAEAAVTA